VTALLSISLLSFLAGTHEPTGWKRRLLFWAFYAFAALAVLTKGLIGIVIPVMVIGAWIFLLGEWRLLKTIELPSGLALFLLIAAPWHVLVGLANPEFFKFYFIHEHFLRYLTKIHSRYEPPWFFIPVLIIGLFPWTAFLVQAVGFSLPGSWRERHEHRDALFLLLWAGLVFLFFSASDSKLIPYILPAVPPLALLIGRYLAAGWNGLVLPGLKRGIIALSVAMLLLAVCVIALQMFVQRPEIADLGRYPLLFAAVLVLTAAVALILLKWRGLRFAMPALLAGTAFFLMVLNASAGRLEPHSTKALAEFLKPRLHAGDQVASFGTYFQDLPVYLERRIIVVNWAGELNFGMSVEDTSAWMMANGPFWKRWNGPETIYLFTNHVWYEVIKAMGMKDLYPVADTDDIVLLTNKGDRS
jgi:4-amino-4-deoxy-L-arabinose transferase-like glycosyltransferase